jgi:hypothetical protein
MVETTQATPARLAQAIIRERTSMSQYPAPGEVPPPGQFGQPAYDQGQYGQPQYGQPAYGQPQYPPPPAGSYPAGQPMYPQQPSYGQPPGQFGSAPYGQQFYPPARVAKPTGWFVVNWLFFWPSAIYSLVSHWNKIDPAAYSGDLAGAQLHAAKVKKLGIIALCIGLALIVADIVYISTVASTLTTY